jgi:polysaccharide biosynthesis transport protein
VEWGKTARQAVRVILDSTPEVKEKCIGVIYNKADRRKMKMYASFGGAEYYYKYYNKYYRS